jgi:hypothetical protein
MGSSDLLDQAIGRQQRAKVLELAVTLAVHAPAPPTTDDVLAVADDLFGWLVQPAEAPERKLTAEPRSRPSFDGPYDKRQDISEYLGAKLDTE